MNKFLIIGLSFMISNSLFATDDMNHDHKGHVHVELIDGKDLYVDPDRYQKFLKDLEDCQIAVVSVIGMVCDFCAQGLEKTFKKDKNVKKIDVDLSKGKVLIAYSKDKAIESKEIEIKILANGQNDTVLIIIYLN